jgi:hypothetical protein
VSISGLLQASTGLNRIHKIKFYHTRSFLLILLMLSKLTFFLCAAVETSVAISPWNFIGCGKSATRRYSELRRLLRALPGMSLAPFICVLRAIQ